MLAEARRFLVHSLKGKSNRREIRHPWRKSWEFVVLHSLRVEAYVTQILQQEPHPLSTGDITLLRLAAILHDIGRLEEAEPHAQTSAEMATHWLMASPHLAQQIASVEKLASVIAKHSDKDAPEEDYLSAVLKDADILDEIGAISICMSMNWLDFQSPFYLHHLLERLSDFELRFCDEQFARLNTNAGRQILSDKKRFIETFIEQLHSELEGSQQFTSLLKAEGG